MNRISYPSMPADPASLPPLRVAWWHPKLTDYRRELMRLIAERHAPAFFFLWRSDLEPPARAVYAQRPPDHIGMRPSSITASDRRALRESIRSSDVFVSSFLGNIFTVWGLVFAKRYGKGVVVWEEMQWLPAGHWLRRALIATVARFVDAYFVLGRIQADTLCSLGVDRDRIFIANECPGADYATVPARSIDVPFADDCPLFLFIGRFVEFKGIEYLLDAFAEIERSGARAGLVLAGDGVLRASLEERVRVLGLRNVHFAGFVDDIQVKSWLLRRATALIVPSVRIPLGSEGGPIVVPEALSAGLPVIASDATGSSAEMIIEGVNGALVRERDARALAASMSAMLRSGPSREQVRATFEALGDHGEQARQLERAMRYASRRR